MWGSRKRVHVEASQITGSGWSKSGIKTKENKRKMKAYEAKIHSDWKPGKKKQGYRQTVLHNGIKENTVSLLENSANECVGESKKGGR